MSGPTFVSFCASDWLAGTRALSPAERGVYIDLLALIYEAGGPIENNRRRLSRVCGTSASAFAKLLAALMEDGKIRETEDGFLTNDRAEIELGKVQEKRDAARAAADARWSSDRENRTPTRTSSDRKSSRQRSEKRREINEPDMLSQCERNANQNHNLREANASHKNMADPVPAKPVSKPREPDRFPEFWDAYGHKVAKGAAAKAWKAAIRRADPETIIAAASGYAAVRDPNFVKHPATWLNGDGWEDDLSTYQRKETIHARRQPFNGAGNASGQQSRILDRLKAMERDGLSQPERFDFGDSDGPFGAADHDAFGDRDPRDGGHVVWLREAAGR